MENYVFCLQMKNFFVSINYELGEIIGHLISKIVKIQQRTCTKLSLLLHFQQNIRSHLHELLN